jgi:hypothetical protein
VLLGSVARGQSLNRFAFVTGRPVSFIDPLGLEGVYSIAIGMSMGEANFAKPSGPSIDPYSFEHITRNSNNRCPLYGPSLEERGFFPLAGFTDCQGYEWTNDQIGARSYHGFEVGNMSYRRDDPENPGSGFQCVYDKDGNLVTEGIYRGTYDIVAPYISFWLFLDPIFEHKRYDVYTHDINMDYHSPDLTQTYCDCK